VAPKPITYKVGLSIVDWERDLSAMEQRALKAEKKLEGINLAKGFTASLKDIDRFGVEAEKKIQQLNRLELAKKQATVDFDIRNAERELKRLGTLGDQELKQLGTKFASAGKSMTLGLTAPVVAGFAATIKSASDLFEVTDLVDRQFGKSSPASKAIHDFGKNAASSFGLSQREAEQFFLGYAGQLQKVVKSQDDLIAKSTELTKRAVDFGSAKNIGNDEVFAKFSSALSGQVRAVREYGIDVSAAAVKQEAYTSGIAKFGTTLNEQQKTLARYNIILRDTKDIQGNFAETAASGSLANQLKIARAEVENSAASLGQLLIPVAIRAAKTVGGLAQEFAGLPSSVKGGIVGLGGVVSILGPVAFTAGKAITAIASLRTALDSMRNAEGALTGVGKGIAGLGIAGAVVGGVLALKGVLDGIEESKVDEKIRSINKALADTKAGALAAELKKTSDALAVFEEAKSKQPKGILRFVIDDNDANRGRLVKSKEEISRFKKSFDEILNGGNIAGAQRVADGLKGQVALNGELNKKIQERIRLEQQAGKDSKASQAIIDGKGALSDIGERNAKREEEFRLAKARADEEKATRKAAEKAAKDQAREERKAAAEFLKDQKTVNEARLDELKLIERKKSAHDSVVAARSRASEADARVAELETAALQKNAKTRDEIEIDRLQVEEKRRSAEEAITSARERAAEADARIDAVRVEGAKKIQAIRDKGVTLDREIVSAEDDSRKAKKASGDAADELGKAEERLRQIRGQVPVDLKEVASAEREVSQARRAAQDAERNVGEAQAALDTAKAKQVRDSARLQIDADNDVLRSKNQLTKSVGDLAELEMQLNQERAGASKDAARELAAANKEIESSIKDVERANESVIDAEKRLAELRNETTTKGPRRVAASERDLEQARIASGKATESIATAQDALDQARKDGKPLKDITKLEIDLRLAQLSAADAADRVIDQEERLASIRDEAAGKGDKFISAEKAVAAAKERLTEATSKQAEAQAKLEQVQANAIDQKRIADLEEKIAAAKDAVTKSTDNVREAEEKANGIRGQLDKNAQDVKRAEENLARAREDSETANKSLLEKESDLKEVRDGAPESSKRVKDAEERVRDARSKAASATQTATEAEQKLMEKRRELSRLPKEIADAEKAVSGEVEKARRDAEKAHDAVTEAIEKQRVQTLQLAVETEQARARQAKADKDAVKELDVARQAARKAHDEVTESIGKEKTALLEIAVEAEKSAAKQADVLKKLKPVAAEAGKEIADAISTAGKSWFGGKVASSKTELGSLADTAKTVGEQIGINVAGLGKSWFGGKAAEAKNELTSTVSVAAIVGEQIAEKLARTGKSVFGSKLQNELESLVPIAEQVGLQIAAKLGSIGVGVFNPGSTAAGKVGGSKSDPGNAIVAEALKTVGLDESGSNAINAPGQLLAGQKIVGDINAWCEKYVNALLKKVGIDLPAGVSASTIQSLQAFKKAGAGIATSQAGVGDLLYKSRGDGLGHVAIVESVNNDGTVNIIEGNAGDKVNRRKAKLSEFDLGAVDTAKLSGFVAEVAVKSVSNTTQVKSSTSRATRNNNPGNIVSGKFADDAGATGSDGRFATFATPEQGFAALKKLLSGPGYKGLTLDSAIKKYAPDFENDTAKYTSFLKNTVGVSGSTKIQNLTAAQFQKLVDGIAKFEGFQGGTTTELKSTTKEVKKSGATQKEVASNTKRVAQKSEDSDGRIKQHVEATLTGNDIERELVASGIPAQQARLTVAQILKDTGGDTIRALDLLPEGVANNLRTQFGLIVTQIADEFPDEVKLPAAFGTAEGVFSDAVDRFAAAVDGTGNSIGGSKAPQKVVVTPEPSPQSPGGREGPAVVVAPYIPIVQVVPPPQSPGGREGPQTATPTTTTVQPGGIQRIIDNALLPDYIRDALKITAIPAAKEGFFPAKPGGYVLKVAEGGRDEAVISVDPFKRDVERIVRLSVADSLLSSARDSAQTSGRSGAATYVFSPSIDARGQGDDTLRKMVDGLDRWWRQAGRVENGFIRAAGA
jgi:CHAP domain